VEAFQNEIKLKFGFVPPVISIVQTASAWQVSFKLPKSSRVVMTKESSVPTTPPTRPFPVAVV